MREGSNRRGGKRGDLQAQGWVVGSRGKKRDNHEKYTMGDIEKKELNESAGGLHPGVLNDLKPRWNVKGSRQKKTSRL